MSRRRPPRRIGIITSFIIIVAASWMYGDLYCDKSSIKYAKVSMLPLNTDPKMHEGNTEFDNSTWDACPWHWEQGHWNGDEGDGAPVKSTSCEQGHAASTEVEGDRTEWMQDHGNMARQLLIRSACAWWGVQISGVPFSDNGDGIESEAPDMIRSWILIRSSIKVGGMPGSVRLIWTRAEGTFLSSTRIRAPFTRFGLRVSLTCTEHRPARAPLHPGTSRGVDRTEPGAAG